VFSHACFVRVLFNMCCRLIIKWYGNEGKDKAKIHLLVRKGVHVFRFCEIRPDDEGFDSTVFPF